MISRKFMIGAAALSLALISPAMLAADAPDTAAARLLTKIQDLQKQLSVLQTAPAPVAEATPAGTTPAATAPTAGATVSGTTEIATAPAAGTTAPGAAPAAATSASSPAARLAAAVAAMRASKQMTPEAVATESFDKYETLITNNPFEKVRRTRTDVGVGYVPGPPVVLTPEQSTVLRGIVQELDTPGAPYFAYLEDLRTNEEVKVRMGAPYMQGKLANPTLNSVDFVRNGITKRIEVGNTLAGRAAPLIVPYEETDFGRRTMGRYGLGMSTSQTTRSVSAGAGIGTGASAETTAEPPSPDEIAEQMRLQRIKDLQSPRKEDWSTGPAAAASAVASTALPTSAEGLIEQMKLNRQKQLGQGQ